MLGLSCEPTTMTAWLLIAVASLTAPASAWLNGHDNPLSYDCPSNQAVIAAYSDHSNHNEDRVWSFTCERTSASLSGGTSTGWTNNFDDAQYYTCPGNQVMTGLSSYHSNNDEDRRWSFRCKSVNGASTTNCRWNGDANSMDNHLSFGAASTSAIAGMKSYHSNSKEDRIFNFYTCEINCDRDNGYLRDDRYCELQYCGGLSLPQGTLTGNCNGNFNERCTYSKCDTGFEFTAFGSTERHCTWVGNSVQWTGNAKECIDIDECITGEEDCFPGSTCVNTFGSYECPCIYGEQRPKSCYVPTPSITVNQQLEEMTIHISGTWTSEFPQYQISVAKWAYDLSAKEDILGFPKTVRSPLTSHRVINLEAGIRFRVVLTPVDHNDKLMPYFSHIAYVNGNDPQTICGCLPNDPSGAPTQFEVYQFKGHVLFKWSDESQCEDAFAFTRNGVGLAARFPVTEQAACSSIQEPLTIYDDLTIQSSGDFAELEEGQDYALPEGTFFYKRHEAITEGDKRFKYPKELQREGGHFSTTSTTTTAPAEGIPADEERYYPGISSPVTSASECYELCTIRSEWCLGFVVQTTHEEDLICHQLRVLEERTISNKDKSAISYERLTVSGTGVSGTFIFEGSQEDCEQACLESTNCVMTFVDSGVCGIMNKEVEVDNHVTVSMHLDPTYSRLIPGPEPGTIQEYCIRAVKPEWYDPQGYSSDPTCADYKIQWESYIEGQVLIDSNEIHLAVEHVTVEFEIGGEVRGRRITNEDGKFYIHVLTDKLRGPRHKMTLRFSKTTGNIKHSFSCGGLPCTEQHIILEHLNFDEKIEVRDTTSVPFMGIVSIGGTEHEGLPDGCPLKDVEVCVYDRHQANTLIDCDFTDSKGRYLVRAVLGTSVTTSVSYQNSSHTFQRVKYKKTAANAPSGLIASTLFTADPVYVEYFDVTEDKLWENINYKDVTQDVTTVDIAGGWCNHTLGDAVIEFRYDMCPTWVREEVISERLTNWHMPAQIITVRFKEITRNFEYRGEITRYFSAVLGNSRSLYADLRNPADEERDKKTVRFEYHPPPQLTVEFGKRMRQNCNTTGENGEHRPLNVLQFNTEMVVTVKAIEDYGEGIGTCDAVPGIIDIENQLGERPETVDILNATTGLSDKQLKRLKRCHSPCALPVIMDERQENGRSVFSNTRVEIEIMTGSPETNPQALSPDEPHTKLFRASMHNMPYDPVAVYEKVVVVGDKVISEYFSVPFPRYQPLTVVQDPPGGLSTITYSNSYSNYVIKSQSHEEFHGFYISADLAAIKLEDESDQCNGLGAAMCKKIMQTESTPLKLHFETDNAWGGKDEDDNFSRERVWSFGVDITTSDDPMMPGIVSDMFLVPALNVIWLETEEVSFDTEQCRANLNTRVKWSLRGDENKEILSWISAFEIEHKEIPDLKKLLKLAQESPDPDDSEEDQQEKIDELTRAISAWQGNLDRNQEVRQDAGNGLLNSVQKLWGTGGSKHQCMPTVAPGKNPLKVAKLQSQVTKMHMCDSFDNKHLRDIADKGISLAPHDLISNARNFDGSSLTDEKQQELREINAIKFSGGGSTYTFTYDVSNSDNTISSTHRTHDVQLGLSGDVDFKIFGIGMSFEGAGGYHYQGDKENEDEAGVNREHAVEFTLGDPDVLDVIDVEIYIHPDYGTLVFHVSSGQTSCPHEPNTVHLERPGISILKRPLAPVLPDEPAVFELLLTNDGPGYSDFNMFSLNWMNEDDLFILVNGETLAPVINFEGFPAGARRLTVMILRGPNKYSYEPVAIGWRSLCEADRHPTNGFLNDEVTTVEYAYLETNFLQECSPVQLVGEIGESGAFSLNAETMSQDYKPGQVRVVSFNPAHAERTWLEDDRLEKVVVEFKPVNSHVWLLARDDKGDALDVRAMANEYGYVTSWWDASALMEGDYHLRVRAQCQASINEMPDGIDVKHSSTAVGRVDRDPPVVFGFPEPSDGEFFPGDAMSFEFSENVECRKPFIFQVTLNVDGFNRDFNNNNMVIVCEGRKISMSLRRGFTYDDVNGLTATLLIENVKDLNDNVMVRPPEHTFRFAELDLDGASAELSGIVLPISYEAEFADANSDAFQSFAASVAAEIAELVEVDVSRVVIVRVEPADPTNYNNGVSLTIRFQSATAAAASSTERRRRATDDASATQLASLVEQRLQDNTQTSSLSMLSSASVDNIEVAVQPSTEDTASAAASSSSSSSVTGEQAAAIAEMSSTETQSSQINVLLVLGSLLIVAVAAGAVLIGMLYSQQSSGKTNLKEGLKLARTQFSIQGADHEDVGIHPVTGYAVPLSHSIFRTNPQVKGTKQNTNESKKGADELVFDDDEVLGAGYVTIGTRTNQASVRSLPKGSFLREAATGAETSAHLSVKDVDEDDLAAPDQFY